MVKNVWPKGFLVVLVFPFESFYSSRQLVLPLSVNRLLSPTKSTTPEPRAKPSKGHPQWYGEKFDLKDEATWHEPAEVVQTNFTTKRKLIDNDMTLNTYFALVNKDYCLTPVVLHLSSMKRIGSPSVFWPMFNCGQPEI